MSNDIFGDFQDDWAGAEPAAKGNPNLGRILPGNYQVMLATVDPGDGIPVDHEIIDNSARGGSKGIKIFLEVIAPEKVSRNGETFETKGKIVEHVFWVTQRTLPYIKRDVKTIFGRDIPNISDLLKVRWAGRTAEVGIKDEEYNGYVNSRVNFWNAWAPAKPAADPKKPAGSKKPAAAQTEEEVAF